MKVIDVIIDGFWVAALIWAVLMFWDWGGSPMPPFARDMLYAITGVMDFWLYLNAILGTVRFIRKILHVVRNHV